MLVPDDLGEARHPLDLGTATSPLGRHDNTVEHGIDVGQPTGTHKQFKANHV